MTGTTFAFMTVSAVITAVFLRDMGKVGAKKAKKVSEPLQLEELASDAVKGA